MSETFVLIEVFLIETNGVSTTIKANNTKMYLSMTVDGVGVPDSYPKFTNRHANGSSTTVVEVSYLYTMLSMN